MDKKISKFKNNAKYKGIMLIILSAFFFSMTNTFVKLAGDLPSVQKSFFRNFVAAIISLVVILKNNESLKVDKKNMKFLFIRAVLGTIGILCNFYALDHLLMPDATILNKMSPFFTLIACWVVLKEKLSPVQVVAIIIAFIGSLFVIKPSFSNILIVPSIIGFCGGLASGTGFSFVRLLGKRGVKGIIIVFFFSAFSCLLTLPYIILNYHPMSIKQVIILLFTGLAAAGGQFSITTAYYYAPAREISVYDYFQIIFAAIISFVIFHQVPDKYSWIGYGIIFLMAFLMFVYNKDIENKKKC
ncbi:DMT family transporter [Fusobacterium sp. PH5-44]|uniref:DMT family transporter n=1 Tax=unclassified Fusobacterium TaxID=2648384 RepID=UPI003D1C6467